MKQNKTKLVLALIGLVIFTSLVHADSWTSDKPSHSTLYVDTLTSKIDASAVNIADSQGLFVTGDVTTLGKVGIGTTGPNAKLEVATSNAKSAIDFWSTSIFDTTSAAAGVGGGIQFNGYKTAQTNGGLFAAIDGQKESGTAGEEKGKLSLWTNDGTQLQKRLTIDSTGNVGIGITNPISILDIGSTNGQFAGTSEIILRQLTETVGNRARLSFQLGTETESDANSLGVISLGIADGGANPLKTDMSFLVNAGDSQATRMTIKSTGNVGIGTTTPDQKLVVAGDIKITSGGSRFLLRNAANNADITALQRDGSDNLELGAVNSGTNLIFYTNAIERMRINSGNVGIGTTNPAYKLTVVGDINATGVVRSEDGINTNVILGGTSGGPTGIQAQNDVGTLIAMALNANILQLYTGSNERMRIDASGNVGIGSTNPVAKLHLKASDNSWGAGLSLEDDITTNKYQLIFDDRFRLGYNSVERLVIDTSGNVGIGTTSPTSKLHVIGKATITGGVDPPYVSFSGESHESIRGYAENVSAHEEAMMFWNGNSKRIEIYNIGENRFYTINGELIGE